MPESSCISGVHRQSSRSNTIILGKSSSLFELQDDDDAAAVKALLPLPMLKKECDPDACLKE